MSDNLTTWSNRLGIGGLYIFSLFAFLGTAGANLGLFLMLVGLLVDWKRVWPIFRREPLFWLFLTFFAYVYVRASFAALEFPESADLQWDDARGWAYLWLFLLVAWWTDGEARRITRVLGLALAGLTTKMVLELDHPTLERIVFDGVRYEFGFAAIAAGLFSGIALMGLALFAPRALRNAQSPGEKVVRFLLLVTLLLFFLQAHVATHSRGAWLAMLGGMVAVAGLVVVRYRAPFFNLWSGKRVLMLLGGVLLLGWTVAMNSDVIGKRMGQAEGVLLEIVSNGLDVEQVPYTSLGKRVHMAHFGFQRFLDRPLFGWGPGSRIMRLLGPEHAESRLEEEEIRKLNQPHLHNGYLSVLVRLGLVGFVLFAGATVIVVRGLWRGYKTGRMSNSHVLFLVGAMIETAIWNLSDSRIVHVDFAFLTILIVGTMYSWRLHERKREGGYSTKSCQTDMLRRYAVDVA